ncbi:hypothetical protein [Vitreoscilla stercoraria]|uniref:Uncharacterized protein n=1 Tax=Vitreoscilla stercoraria TaxID=61 RepID=A0ABY4EEJ7_VITST|nr:hypothetical protein [Vitreoscilla stercoraria]UOO93360.1 hypothetical protein LVJ81_04855 [Vitreoscilla stercoraria]
MAKYLIRKTATVMVALFISGIAGASLDRNDAALNQSASDLMFIETQERQRLAAWHQRTLQIEAEQAQYEAALYAAMEARNATGNYGEVYEYE